MPQPQQVSIKPPQLVTLSMKIVGTSPLMQHAFPKKAVEQMRAKHEAGSTAKKGKQREARDFDMDYRQAQHISVEGWNGIHAAAFRNACISACRLVGFAMTRAKLSIFCMADGFDNRTGDPLVRVYGTPEKNLREVRNETGVVDLRMRPMWREWTCNLRLRFDAEQFTNEDIINLVMRAGEQVGIGEGRHDSKNSAGLGFGCFTIDPASVKQIGSKKAA